MKKKILILVLLIACSFGLLLVPSTKKASAANADELDYIEIDQSYYMQSFSVILDLYDEYNKPIKFRKDDALRVKVSSLEDFYMFSLFSFADSMDCTLDFVGYFYECCSCGLKDVYSSHLSFSIVSQADSSSFSPTYSEYIILRFNYDALIYPADDVFADYFQIFPHENWLSDYEKGYEDGKDCVDITIDNQEQYDAGFDVGYSSGYDKGYQDGIDNAISEFTQDLSYLKYGPILHGRIECMFVGDYSSRVVLDYDTFNGFKNGTYIDFAYLYQYTYLVKYGGDSVPTNFSTPFNVTLVFDPIARFGDFNFSVKGVYCFSLYNYDDEIISTIYPLNEIGDSYISSYYNVHGEQYVQKDEYINMISFECYKKDIDNFTLTFASIDTSNYQDGYYAGYDKGYGIGNDAGLEKGKELGYSEGYGDGYAENNFTLQNLFWTIAGLPFESFKSIWSVNFLGVYIADFITGLLLAGVAIFIIKRVIF